MATEWAGPDTVPGISGVLRRLGEPVLRIRRQRTYRLRELVVFTAIATVVGYFAFTIGFAASTYAICAWTKTQGWQPYSCNILYQRP